MFATLVSYSSLIATEIGSNYVKIIGCLFEFVVAAEEEECVFFELVVVIGQFLDVLGPK